MLTKKTEKSSKSRFLLCAAALAALTAVGCAADESAVAGEEQEDDVLELATQQASKVPYFTDIRASGSGCAAGTWDKSISSDGAAFTVRFSEYQAEVESGTRRAGKDCTLLLTLRSPSGVSYAVSDFYYQGYSWLEKGVVGYQIANYYFQGSPADATKEKRSDLVGPYDDEYEYHDTVRTQDLVWSPCGLNRTLRVATRLGIEKTGNSGNGYVSLAAIDGRTTGKIILKLSHRTCS